MIIFLSGKVTEDKINIKSGVQYFLNDHYDSKILIEEGRTILEWTQIQSDTWHIDKFYVERRISSSDWEVIGVYHPGSNTLTHRFIDESDFILNNHQKILIISYRLKVIKGDIIEVSSEISYDFWWKKYLSFIDSYEKAPHLLSSEIFKYVEQSIKNVLYKKYISTFYKMNVNEYFIIDEACQEIFLKLLEKRVRPGLNYYSFWKYLNRVVNNWMLSYLIRNKNSHFIRLSEEIQELERSPEDKMIKMEESKIFIKAFTNLFNVYLDQLWTTSPICALTTESWIRRKKDFVENFSECITKSLDSDPNQSEMIRLDELNYSDKNQMTLYSGILSDILSVANSPDLMKKLLRKIPERKRDSFQSGVNEYCISEESKSINRIKQRISRSLTTIRLKMQEDLKDF